MKGRILLILGHPDGESLNGALAEAYKEGAESSGAEVRILRLGDLKFDPVLWKGYKQRQELEPDLLAAQKLIEWAEHLVLVYPTWWSTIPALMKGFFDRILLPGFAYNSGVKNSLPEKLLKGRTAHLITTMDSPGWYYRWSTGRPGFMLLKKGILNFCGIKTVRISSFQPAKFASQEKRVKWLEKTRRLGELVA